MALDNTVYEGGGDDENEIGRDRDKVDGGD